MATYKITIPVTLIVEIDEANENAGPQPMLHGDTPIVAVRRAIGCLMSGPTEKRKALGVRRLFINGSWDKFPVETLAEGARITGFPAQSQPAPANEATEKPSAYDS